MSEQSASSSPGGFLEGFQAAQADPMSTFVFQKVQESCPVKATIALTLGFALGGAFGMFMSSVDTGQNMEEFNKMKFREQVRFTLKDMGAKSYSSAKNFAVVGAVFSGTECVIESFRAKNDIYNGLAAGCLTGGALAARAGPLGIVSGCATFAAFSGAIDSWMRNQ
ncbi:mitochondrial import inner membrane translocase subunit Tim22 [Zopfochytrium polystomum]|nr:mitochondrial import inner membrane translocase subunit Tim22 [Zopfochytrium polystomum]